eukprot:scaffold125814_cov47-Cyclotella_meneghiniana.AAC.1
MIYPCPRIAIIAISLMQGVAFLIASIELGGVYHLQFRGWELAIERRWSSKLYLSLSRHVQTGAKMSLSRDMSGHVAYLSHHEDKCLVLETCRDMSQDIYVGEYT